MFKRENLKNANKYIRLLDKISISIVSSQDVSEALDFITHQVIKEFEAAVLCIWRARKGDTCRKTPGMCHFESICDSRNKCLHLLSRAGSEEIWSAFQRVPLGAYKVGIVAKTGNRLLINDLQDDDRIYDRQKLKAERIVAFAGYPLLFSGDLLGVMGLLTRTRIEEDEFELLGSFATQVAIAIKAGELREECEAKEKKINQDAQRFQEIEAELKRAQEKYALTLKSSREGIALVEPKSGRILEVNEAFVNLVARTKRDLLTLEIDELPWKEGVHSFRDQLKRINHDGPLALRKLALERGEQPLRWLDIKACVAPGKGRTEVQLFFRDVTGEIETKKGK